MGQDLSQYVHALAGRRALLVGDLILDRYLTGDAERISPEAPVPVLRVVEKREAVGGSANVAGCLKALGCEVTCCGVIGEDRHGETLKHLLADLGVDASGVISVANRPTTTKTRLVGLAQHRHRQQLIRVDDEDASPLAEDQARRIATLACDLVDQVDVVCIEDYDKGVVTEALVQALVERAKAGDKLVIGDPARLSDFGRYRGVSLLTPNRQEFSTAAGRTFETHAELAESAQAMMTSLAIRAMVVTLDRDGAILLRQDHPFKHIPTTPRSVYDNAGAGDAVLAMLAAAVAGGADLEQATHLANIAGGLEVERFGCVPIQAEEVLAELRLKQKLTGGKVRRIGELTAELGLRRDRGETVAFTNGCFDILHAGHADLLQRARREASVLVVGLNSDESIRQLNKGPDRPINSFDDRARLLAALECVDYVVGFEGADPEELIRALRPDVLVKGEDWAEDGVVGASFVESNGGRVVLMPLVKGLSTTAMVERIRGETG